MAWPQAPDYAEAIQNPGTSFREPDIRTGTAASKPSGEPLLWTGNFAAVFEVRSAAGDQKWAVKCFTREVAGLQERYRQVGEHLRQCRLPFMVEFQYVPESVLVRGSWYPFLKMEWVEGLRLDELITQCFQGKWNAKGTLRQLCEMWTKLAARLREARVAHGDLQHGNVLLVPARRGKAFGLKLIDYDGMYVPSLADRPPGELGHASYQHPQRLREGGYGPEVDRFSHLLIYCALRCLIVGGRGLWERFHDGDNLLFGPRDLRHPETSPVFRHLWKLADPAARTLAGHLALAAAGPPAEVPLLDQVAYGWKVPPLLPERQQAVERLLSQTAPSRPPPLPAREPAATAATDAPAAVPGPWWTGSAEPPLPGGTLPRLPGTVPDLPRAPGKLWRRIAGRAAALGRRRWLWLTAAGGALVVALSLLLLPRTLSGPSVPSEKAETARAETSKPADRPSSAGDPDKAPAVTDTEPIEMEPELPPEIVGPEPAKPEPAKPPPAEAKPPVARDRRLRIFSGPAGYSNVVGFSPDGRRIASRGNDRSVRVWDAADGRHIVTLNGQTDERTNVAFSPDGRLIASGSRETASVQVWDAASGHETAELKGHKFGVISVAFSVDGRRIVAGGYDGSVRVWDAASGREMLALTGQTGKVWSVAFSPDGGRIAAAGDDFVKVWDATDGHEILTLPQNRYIVRGVAFSSDGRRIASGGYGGTVRVWDAADGRETLTLKGHTGEVRSVAFSPDGRQIASGDEDKTVKVWDAATGQDVLTLQGHTSSVMSVAFSPDGRQVLSGSNDGVAIWWDVTPGPTAQTLTSPWEVVADPAARKPKPPTIVKAKPKPPAIAANKLRTFHCQLGYGRCVAFSPDRRRIASITGDKTVIIWDAASGKEIVTLKGHTSWVTRAAFSPDGWRVASGSADNTVKAWDAASGREILTIRGHASGVTSVGFSPDGRQIASGSEDGTAKVSQVAWGSDGGSAKVRKPASARRIPVVLNGHIGAVYGLAFSPDGRWIVTGGKDRTLKVWEANTGRENLTIDAHMHWVLTVAFSPDGRQIASGSWDETVNVWDVASGKRILTLRGQTGPVMAVAFSPDGERIASGGNSGIVEVWNLLGGQKTVTLGERRPTGVEAVAFSPDGRQLLVGAGNDVVLWDVSGEAPEADPALPSGADIAGPAVPGPDAEPADEEGAEEPAAKKPPAARPVRPKSPVDTTVERAFALPRGTVLTATQQAHYDALKRNYERAYRNSLEEMRNVKDSAARLKARKESGDIRTKIRRGITAILNTQEQGGR